MGTLSANRGYKIPTVGGDSGGEDGTDTGGWPQQIVDTINAIDADMQTAIDANITIPNNVCVVLDRDTTTVSAGGGTSPVTVYSRSIASAEILGRSIRIDFLGEISSQISGGKFTVSLQFGAQTLWEADIPADGDTPVRAVTLCVHMIPTANNAPRLFGSIQVGSDAGGVFGYGNPYEANGIVSAIASGSALVDMTVAQTFEIVVTPNISSLGFDKRLVKLIRE